MEAPEAFRIFEAAAENKSQKRVQEIMTDMQELYMGEIKEISKTEAIKLHTSVRYSPESDGAAERTGVLTNAMRATLCDSVLPKSQWAEALSAVTYMQNRIPTKVLGGRTPYEIIYRDKPDLSHLAFGVSCAVVKLKEKLKRLYDRVVGGAVMSGMRRQVVKGMFLCWLAAAHTQWVAVSC